MTENDKPLSEDNSLEVPTSRSPRTTQTAPQSRAGSAATEPSPTTPAVSPPATPATRPPSNPKKTSTPSRHPNAREPDRRPPGAAGSRRSHERTPS